MSRPAARLRNARGQGERLRTEILEAAVALLEETGDRSALTMRGVARRAGISAPSIYDHFDSLAVLIDALLAQSFEQLRAALAASVAGRPDPVQALVAAGLAYVRFGWQHRARYQLMFDADGYAANAIETFALVRDLIAACTRDGLGDSDNAHLDTWMVWAGLHGVATLEKPARADQRRLGTLDRPAMTEVMIRRLARIRDMS